MAVPSLMPSSPKLALEATAHSLHLGFGCSRALVSLVRSIRPSRRRRICHVIQFVNIELTVVSDAD